MSTLKPGKTTILPQNLRDKLGDKWVRTGVFGDGSCFFHSVATVLQACQPTDKSCGHRFRTKDLQRFLTRENWEAFWKTKGIDPIPSFEKAKTTLPKTSGRGAWAYDALIVFCLEQAGYNYIFFDARQGKPFCGVFGELVGKPTIVILWLDRSHFEPMGFMEDDGSVTYLFPHAHPQVSFLRETYQKNCNNVSLRHIVGGETAKVIYFYRKHCRFCQEYTPTFDKVAKEFPEGTMVKRDLSTQEDAKEVYNFTTVPAIIRLSDSKHLHEDDRTEVGTRLFVHGRDTLVYTYAFDSSVDKEARQHIETNLQDERGWKGLGYSFEAVEEGMADITYFLVPNEWIAKTYSNSFDGFSVCHRDLTRGTANVYFNQKNWNDPPKAFDGSLRNYRDYVIQHETGHALEFPHHDQQKNKMCHPMKANEMCHPMYQQTRGTKNVCNANPWITMVV